MKRIFYILLFVSTFSYGQFPMPLRTPTATASCPTDTDAGAIVTALTGAGATVTGPQCTAIDNYVIAQKAHGIWSKKTGIFVPLVSNATANAINWKTASGTGTSFNGGWTHNSAGATPDGAAHTYFNTGINCNTLSSSDSYMSYYFNENFQQTGKVDMGTEGGSSAFLIQMYNNEFFGQSSYNSFIDYNYGSTLIYAALNRNSGSSFDGWGSGTKLQTITSSAVTYENGNIYVSAVNYAGLGDFYNSPRKFVYVSFGASLSDTEAANDYTDVQALMTAFGVNF